MKTSFPQGQGSLHKFIEDFKRIHIYSKLKLSNLVSNPSQDGRGEAGEVAVPVGGTPDRPLQAEGAPRSLGPGKRLGEGVRPAQLIPRSRAKQVKIYSHFLRGYSTLN